MTRTRNLSLIKRFSLVFAIAALAVPASASAHRDGGGFTQQASPSFVPAIPAPHGNVGPGTTGLGPVAPKVSGSGSAVSTDSWASGYGIADRTSGTPVDSGFDWSDASVGAGFAAAAIMRAMAGAMTVRRHQGGLGYR